MKIIEPISAIVSWENYEYQGHIALYIALERIHELLQKKGYQDIQKYDLQIEGEEDFSIRKSGNYLTLHQVKAGKIQLTKEDKFAFIAGILGNNAKYGYFHISNNAKNPSDFVTSTVEYIKILKNELKKKVIYKKDIPDSEDENNYIVIDNISKNNKKASIYRIIKYVSQNSKDKTKIKEAVKQIDETLDEYKLFIEKKLMAERNHLSLQNEDETFMAIYNKKFDNIKQIRMEAYKIIIKILKQECPSYNFVDMDYAALVYDYLLIYMKNRITDNYINNKNKKDEKCILTFTEILSTIKIDYHQKIDTVEYQYYLVLKSIRDVYAEYSTKCGKINCAVCESSEKCNLFKEIHKLNEKEENEKNKIIHNLILMTPQKGKSNNLPSDNLISNLFLDVLQKIKSFELTDKNIYQTIKNKIETFRLTLDDSYNVDDFQRRLSKELEKDMNKALIYESDVLITDRVNEKHLMFDGINVSILGENEIDEIKEITSSTIEKMKKNCYKSKILRVIDKDTALGELKDE